MSRRVPRKIRGLQHGPGVARTRTAFSKPHVRYNPSKRELKQLDCESRPPHDATFASLVRWCGERQDLLYGRRVHARINACGKAQNTFLANLLVQMYSKCHSVQDAWSVFDGIGKRDKSSWNSMIATCAQNGHEVEALQLYKTMQMEGMKPNRFTFLPILSASANLRALTEGKQIHEHLVACGLGSDVAVMTALVNMYGKCGVPNDARSIFDSMQERDLVTWNAMIAAYAKNGRGKEALDLFSRMVIEGVKPDKITFLGILDACASLGSLENGRAVHERIAVSGFQRDVAVRNALLNMYGKCGSIKDARLVFDRMKERNVISWTAMIATYAQNGCGKEALTLFRQMELEGIKPDTITFLIAIEACANLGSLEDGRAIHEHIITRGFQLNVALRTALVNMYGKCGSLKDARMVFDEMHEQNVCLWTSMIAACAQNGRCMEALELFRQMNLQGIKPDSIAFVSTLDACANLGSLENGKAIHECIVCSGFESDVAVRTALVNMYGKCGSLEDARAVFDKMHEENVILWTAMIAAYAQKGHGKEALELFSQMQVKGLKPDKVTFLSILDACASRACLEDGRTAHAQIVSSGLESDAILRTSLVNMYGKCGSVKDASVIFHKIHERDVISWNAMITAYAQNGYGKAALELFRQMALDGVKSDRTTFLGALDACASLACLEKGITIHESIVASGFEADLAVRNALVNMYGKCGALKDARAVFDMMHERDVISWNAMIGAYAQNSHSKEALKLFNQMDFEEIKPNGITFLSVLNACSCIGLIEVGQQYFVSMSGDYGISPLGDHFVCMSDLIGRVGCLDEAEDLIINAPHQPSAVAWTSLLGACRIHGDVDRGAWFAKNVVEVDSHNTSPYVMLSNIYSAAGRWGDAAMARKAMEEGTKHSSRPYSFGSLD